ncbi:MAG: hypothetical protein AB7F65_01830 [Dehalococcoidia bacterium]
MTAEPIVFCERHPGVETALECGRCGTPICPRCMIHTPGGIRCPDCAKLRRPPMYELAPLDYAKAIGVGVVLAGLLGFIGAILFPVGGFRGLFLLLALFVGSAVGGLVAEVIHRVTNGKRGLPMQLIGAGTLVAALAVRMVLSGAFEVDLAGLMIGGVGAVAVWGRLR